MPAGFGSFAKFQPLVALRRTGGPNPAFFPRRAVRGATNCYAAYSNRIPQSLFAVLAALALFAPESVNAHPGGLNAQGCHNDRKNGGYHCHRGSQAEPPPVIRRPMRAIPRSDDQPSSLQQAPAALFAPPLRSSPAVVPTGQPFTCTAILVWDGDGPIWCEEGPRLRIAGIAAREMDGSCRPGHPCPDASGEVARDALVGLLGGPVGRNSTGHILIEPVTLACQSRGDARGNRTAAVCRMSDGRDLAEAMIATGTALAWNYGGDDAP